jgi:hypothetical protein
MPSSSVFFMLRMMAKMMVDGKSSRSRGMTGKSRTRRWFNCPKDMQATNSGSHLLCVAKQST